MTGGERIAGRIYAAAGVYGLIVLLPLLFAEPWLEPAPNRPEDYYGFLCTAATMQLVYLAIAGDPVRFRPLMPIGILSKGAFFAAVGFLWLEGRAQAPALGFASIDLLIGVAFAYAWLTTRNAA